MDIFGARTKLTSWGPFVSMRDSCGMGDGHKKISNSIRTKKKDKRGQVLSAILSAFTYDEAGNYSETAHVSVLHPPQTKILHQVHQQVWKL